MATCPLLLYLKSPSLISAHLRLSYLHINKGPQVPPWQSQEQLNQRGVGSLDSQVQNGFVALDLLGEERQRSGQLSIHTRSWQPSRVPYTDIYIMYSVRTTRLREAICNIHVIELHIRYDSLPAQVSQSNFLGWHLSWSPGTLLYTVTCALSHMDDTVS